MACSLLRGVEVTDNLNRKFEVFGLEAEMLDLHIDRPVPSMSAPATA
jgi:hypothetical protein